MAEKSCIYLFIKFIAVFLVVVSIFICFYPAFKTDALAITTTGIVIAAVIGILASMGIIVSAKSSDISYDKVLSKFNSFLRIKGATISSLFFMIKSAAFNGYLQVKSSFYNLVYDFLQYLISDQNTFAGVSSNVYYESNLSVISNGVTFTSDISVSISNANWVSEVTKIFNSSNTFFNSQSVLGTTNYFTNFGKYNLSLYSYKDILDWTKLSISFYDTVGNYGFNRTVDTVYDANGNATKASLAYINQVAFSSNNILFFQFSDMNGSLFYGAYNFAGQLSVGEAVSNFSLTNNSDVVLPEQINESDVPDVYVASPSTAGTSYFTASEVAEKIFDDTVVSDVSVDSSDISSIVVDTAVPQPNPPNELKDGLPIGNRLLDDLNDSIDDFNNTIDEDVDNILDSLDPIVDLVNSVFNILPAIVQYLISFAVVFLVLRKVVGR